MYQGKITIEANGKTEDEVIEAILFQMHEVIRQDGKGIEIKEVENEQEPV